MAGTSPSSPVTFRSQSNDLAAVTLTGGSTASAFGPLRIDGAQHVRFERMTFEVNASGGIAVHLAAASTDVQFIGNRFRTATSFVQVALTNAASTLVSVTDLVVAQNRFENTALVLSGSGSLRSSNTTVRDNVFENSVAPGSNTAAALEYQDGAQVTGNTITGFEDGLDIAHAAGAIRVTQNQVDVSALGLRVLNSDASSGAPGLMANNAVRTEGRNATGSLLVSQSAHQQVYHNSVDAGAGSFGSAQALFVSGDTGVRIANNILSTAGGAALEVDPVAGVTLNHNVLFTSGAGSALVNYDNTDYATLADYQNATGQGTGSVFADPQYDSDFTPAAPLVADAGTDLTGVVPNDLNGTARTLPVSAGAVEVDDASGTPPLAGTYVIDASGSGDYDSVQAAFDALTSPGISGPVTFEVVAGVYAEQGELANIVGATATNTVTFRGQSGDATDVTLQSPYDAGAQAGPLVLNGIQHVRFEDVTFELTTVSASDAAAVRLTGTSLVEDVRFTGNRFLVTDANAGSSSTPVARGLATPSTVDLHVVDNRFVNTTLSLIGSTSMPATGTVVRGNVLRQQANPGNGEAITLRHHDAPVVAGNDLAGFQGGLRLFGGGASAQVTGNTIDVDGIGLSLVDCDSPSSNPGLAANNRIISANDTGLNVFECVNQHVFHNSVSVAPTDSLRATEFALVVGGVTASGATGTRVANNILVTTGSAALRVDAPTGLTLEHNALFANGRWGGVIRYDDVFYPSLQDYQNATGQGTGSVYANPRYVSNTDLTPRSTFVDDEGTDLTAFVATDANGTARTLPVSMGATEVDSPGPAPLSGTYTIGSGGDYAGFQAAFNALWNRGVGGPVVFDVASGTYEEQPVLGQISGTSPSNTITVRSQSGDAASVTLKGPAPTLILAGADHIRLERMTLEGTTYGVGTLGQSGVVLFKGDTKDARLTGNRFLRVPQPQGVTGFPDATINKTVANGLDIRLADVRIEDNFFNGIQHGISFRNAARTPSPGVVVQGNVFLPAPPQSNEIRTAIRIEDQDEVVVADNIIGEPDGNSGRRSYSAGIAIEGSDGPLRITNNRLVEIGGTAIAVGASSASSADPGLVANNVATSDEATDGFPLNGGLVELTTSGNQQVYHNSFVLLKEGVVLRAQGSGNPDFTGSRVANNIFAATAGGSALNVSDGQGLTLESNALGGGVAYEGTDYASVVAYQNATGQGTGSVAVTPAFVSDADLHLAAPSVTDAALQGIPLPIVSTDIDGEPRSPTAPTGGADEVTTLVATQPGSSGAAVDFGAGYAADVVFSASTTGSGAVSVRRFSNGPRSQSIPEEAFASYRWCIDAEAGLAVGAGTEVRFALDEIPGSTGINDPTGVLVYKRDACGAGAFQDVPTSYDSSTNEIVASVGGFSEFVFAGSSAALPVELVSFDARHDGNAAVHLSWRTASETSNAGFRIERRADAATAWTRVGMVPSQAEGGTSDAALQYTLVDDGIPFGVSTLTYRILQYDLDGTTTVAAEQAIELEGPTAFALEAPFPNPTRGAATLQYALPTAESVRITLYDALGRRLRTLVDQEQAGRHALPIAMDGLASGTYFIRITAGRYTQTKRLVVLR